MMTPLMREFSVMPVNAVIFSDTVAQVSPKLYPAFELSPLARAVIRLSDADSHTIISREASSRIWADVWVRDHEVIDRTLTVPRREEIDTQTLKLDVASTFAKRYATIFHFLGLEDYCAYLAPNSYSVVTQMHALSRLYLYQPSIEELAALPGPNARIRALRLTSDFVPLRIASAMLPVVTSWKQRGGGSETARMLRTAVLLEHQGVPLDEIARLLKRDSYRQIHEYLAMVGIPDEYLDAVG